MCMFDCLFVCLKANLMDHLMKLNIHIILLSFVTIKKATEYSIILYIMIYARL